MKNEIKMRINYKIISVNYIVSSVTGYVSGLLIGYLLNRNWTFIAQVEKSKSYIVGYIKVYVVSLVSSQAFLFFLVEFLLINPLYGNIFAIFLSTVMNFFGTNFYVFKKTEKPYA